MEIWLTLQVGRSDAQVLSCAHAFTHGKVTRLNYYQSDKVTVLSVSVFLCPSSDKLIAFRKKGVIAGAQPMSQILRTQT